MINSVLLSRGYTLLRSGEILMVVKLDGLDVSLVPRVSVDELDERGTYEIVKTFFDLNRLRADAVSEELKPLMSPHGKVTPMKTTNRIEVVETAGNMRRLREMLADEQGASGQELEIREFPLQYVHADDVLSALETLLGMKKDEGPPLTPQQMQQMQQMRQQQQQQGAPPEQKEEPKANLAVNRRNNSIVAHAAPDQLAVIEKAVGYLDVPVSGPTSVSPLSRVSRIRSYRLTQADPDSVVKVLREMGGLSPATQLTIDKDGKTVIANASMVDHVTIAALVEQLNGSARTFDVIQLRRLSADYVAGSIDFLMNGEKKDEDNNRRRSWWSSYGSDDDDKDDDKFQVEADTENNRLLIRANDAEKEEIYDLLAKLGEDPRNAGSGPTTRLIRTLSDEESEQLLHRLEHAWPSLSPNPLQVEPTPSTPADADGEKESDEPEVNADKAGQEARRRATAGSDILLAVMDERSDATAIERERAGDAADAAEGAEAGSEAATAAPAVSITRGPEGLVITSQDAAALDELMDLAAQLSPRRQSYHTFTLKNTYAREVAYLLEDIFDEEEKQSDVRVPYWYLYDYGLPSSGDSGRGRLSDRRPLKFVPDSVTNTILVLNADTKQLAEIKSLIEMYDSPDSIDSQSVRVTKIVAIEYGVAEDIAEVVKDVYRDLLSPNDKALLNAAQPQQKQDDRFGFWQSIGGDSDDDSKVPRFKGLLSIGVDKKANQLVVSSPQFLVDNLVKMIKELDEAAKTKLLVVQVVKVRPHVSAAMIRDALADYVKGGNNTAQPATGGQDRNGDKTAKGGKGKNDAGQPVTESSGD
ncbi:MAG: secretin N-terminal domain-containing protein [Pirellulales bacterium]